MNPRRAPSIKTLRPLLPVVLSIALWGLGESVCSNPALAFHDGGSASCAACHVMHDSVPGQVLFDGTDPLLTASTVSDVCLMCHGGPGGVLSGNPLLPGPERGGGDFGFLVEDNLNDGTNGQTNPIDGHAAGHSIISLAAGLDADPRWASAPGGSFASNQLGCTSCHDPHGNTNFRMLHGSGEVQSGGFYFTNDAPLAIGLDITNPLQTESRSLHTAYISGMSDWCANCHGRYHDDAGNSVFEHGYEEFMRQGRVIQYNSYEGAASPTSGVAATAYIPEVAFEDPGASVTSTQGPSTSSTVMCLSCHRAHASSGPAAGRWDFYVANLNQDGQISGSYPLPSPYPVGEQGQLCAKCHQGSNKPGPYVPQ